MDTRCPHCGSWFMSERQCSAHVDKRHGDVPVTGDRQAEAIYKRAQRRPTG